MSHRQRWRWLADTLMGHPRIRGGQRPRDFPADPAGRNAVACAVALHQLELRPWTGLPGDLGCRFGNWLFAFVLLVEGSLLPGPGKGETEARGALLMLVWQTLRAMNLEGDEGSCHKLIAALGMGLQDARPLTNAIKPCSRWGNDCGIKEPPRVRVAAEAAMVAGAGADHPGRPLPQGVHKNWKLVEALLDAPLWLVTAKAHKVQKYLERGQELRLARGASAWASQSLAAVRELMLGLSPAGDSGVQGLLLLTDVDAVVRFASFEAPQCRTLRNRLRQALKRAWSPTGGLGANQPRFAAFLESLPLPEREGLKPWTCLPDFCIEVSEPLSLRKLCESRPEQTTAAREAQKAARIRNGTRCRLTFPRPAATPPRCSYVRNERGIVAEKDVPWLQGREGDPRISWCGLVWSLAGTTYRMHAAQGLGERLKLAGLPIRIQHQAWVEALQEQQSGVAYLYLDGDGVGKALGTMPILGTFPAGLEVLHRTDEGLLAGTGKVVQAWRAGHGKAPIPTLPVDLVYLGGDDLMCILPEPYLAAFLNGFAGAPKPLAARTFSGAAIIVPALPGTPGSTIPKAARDLLPRVLKLAKGMLKAPPPGTQERDLARIQRLARASGFVLSGSPALEPFTKAVRMARFHLEPLSLAE